MHNPRVNTTVKLALFGLSSLFAFSLWGSLNGWAATWIELGSDNTGAWERIYYIDGDSIESLTSKTPLFRYQYWYREEYLDPARPTDHAFLIEADCDKDQYRILKSRELPHGKATPWLESLWYKVTKQASGEILSYNHMCGQAPL